MGQPTKSQIEKASQILNDKLRDKTNEAAEKNFNATTAKYAQDIKVIEKHVTHLEQLLKSFKSKVEKDKRLKVDMDNIRPFRDKDEDDEDDSELQLIQAKRSHSYYNGYSSQQDYKGFEPDVTKEKTEIDTFILNLTLGTAIMTDISAIVAKLDKIK